MTCIALHAIACYARRMSDALLSQIEAFMAQQHIGEHRFGMLAARNGRLVERLRRGGRVWPETEQCVLAFIAKYHPLSPAEFEPTGRRQPSSVLELGADK